MKSFRSGASARRPQEAAGPGPLQGEAGVIPRQSPDGDLRPSMTCPAPAPGGVGWQHCSANRRGKEAEGHAGLVGHDLFFRNKG